MPMRPARSATPSPGPARSTSPDNAIIAGALFAWPSDNNNVGQRLWAGYAGSGAYIRGMNNAAAITRPNPTCSAADTSPGAFGPPIAASRSLTNAGIGTPWRK